MDIKDNVLLAMKILSGTICVFITIILVGVTMYVWCMRKDAEEYLHGYLVWCFIFGVCVLFTVFMVLSTVLGFLNFMG